MLIRRGGTWSIRKRVPKRVAHLDQRSIVTKALGTDSLREAKRRAPAVLARLEAHWRALEIGIAGPESDRYEAALALARARGEVYRSAEDLARDPIETRRRLLALEASGDVDDVAVGAAVLGLARPPEILLSALPDLHDQLCRDETAGKSPDQNRRARHPRERAVRNLQDVIGDKPLRQIDRADALAFRCWWQDRLAAEDLVPNSANRDIGSLSAMWNRVELLKRLGLTNIWSGLRFRERAIRSPAPLTSAWIETRWLATDALEALNASARDILLTMINTGARPSELCGLTPSQICLTADVPHLDIRPEGRALKTRQAARKIPLVGVSLSAMARNPSGFPSYCDRAPAWSATVNKYLRHHDLFEEPGQTAYAVRHGFDDRLLAVDAPERIRADLMGHALNRPRYGAGASLEQARDWVAKIAL